MSSPVKFDTKEYLEAQKQIALGQVNRWYAGEKLGHPPSDREAIEHFILYGGAANFAAEHRHEFFKKGANY